LKSSQVVGAIENHEDLCIIEFNLGSSEDSLLIYSVKVGYAIQHSFDIFRMIFFKSFDEHENKIYFIAFIVNFDKSTFPSHAFSGDEIHRNCLLFVKIPLCHYFVHLCMKYCCNRAIRVRFH